MCNIFNLEISSCLILLTFLFVRVGLRSTLKTGLHLNRTCLCSKRTRRQAQFYTSYWKHGCTGLGSALLNKYFRGNPESFHSEVHGSFFRPKWRRKTKQTTKPQLRLYLLISIPHQKDWEVHQRTGILPQSFHFSNSSPGRDTSQDLHDSLPLPANTTVTKHTRKAERLLFRQVEPRRSL